MKEIFVVYDMNHPNSMKTFSNYEDALECACLWADECLDEESCAEEKELLKNEGCGYVFKICSTLLDLPREKWSYYDWDD